MTVDPTASDTSQLRNVANLGDVLKHVSLWTVLAALRPSSGRLLYVESNAFRPVASLPSAGRKEEWKQAVESLPATAERIAYAHAEEPYIDQDRYLCSSGIARQLLDARPDCVTDFLLYERGQESRSSLQAYFPNSHVGDDHQSLAIDLAGRANGYDGVVALIDPYQFNHVRNLFPAWLRGLSAAAKKGQPVVVIAFDYTATPDWPNGLNRAMGLAGRIRAGSDSHFNLAVYANPAGLELMRAPLTTLGWSMQREALPEDATLIGIDLAWGNGNTGYARWRRSDGLTIADGSPLPDLDGVKQQLLLDIQSTGFCVVAVDAALRCPKSPNLANREWEALFRRTGRHPQEHTYARYSGGNGARLYQFLLDNGFRDVAEVPKEFLRMVRSGSAKGRWFVEVYPNPVVRAIGGDSNYKMRAEENEAELTQKYELLKTLEERLRQLIGELPVGAPASFPGRDAAKRVEDNLDAIVSLLIPLRLCRLIDHPTPIYLIGGQGRTVERGCIVTLLSRRDEQRFAAEDRDGIMACLDVGTVTPSPHQQEVINAEAPVVRVIARAGSGKTTTMVWRADRVVARDLSANVLLLTFTRNAASDIERALDARIHWPDQRVRCHASTYHGHAFRTLLNYGVPVDGWPVPKNCELLNEMGRESALDLIARAHNWQLGDDWQNRLSAMINKTQPGFATPDNLFAASNEPDAAKLSQYWQQILAFYRKHGLLDFDVVMVLHEYLLRVNRDYFEMARGGATHLIADEFQDTNWPQLAALLHMAGLAPKAGQMAVEQIMAIGDDFQTIYDWRGAVPGIFGEFAKSAEHLQVRCATYSLPENRRSLPPIVAYANIVARGIAQLPEHKLGVGPELIAGRPGDCTAPPVNKGARSVRDAVERLGQEVEDEDITVLAYSNSKLAEARDELWEHDIPATLLSVRPGDMLGFRLFQAALAITFSNRPSIAAWWELARAEKSPIEAGQFLDGFPGSKEGRCLDVLSAFGELCKAVTMAVDGAVAPYTYDGLMSLAKELARADPRVDADLPMCERLVDHLVHDPEFAENPARLLSESTRRDFAAGHCKHGGVRLCTVHGFKGLQSRAVVVLNDGFMGTDDPGKMRLDYVARTKWPCAIARQF